MRAAGLSLLCLVITGPLAAQPAEPPAQMRTSARLSEVLRATLPKYSPEAAPATASSDATAPTDPDTLVLPKMTVQAKRIPKGDPDIWLTDRVIQSKAMHAYKDSLTPLEWAMNCFYIPIFGTPPGARARAAYEAGKRADAFNQMSHVIDAVEKTDPKLAAQLRFELTHDPDAR